jgi:hypothetical protein
MRKKGIFAIRIIRFVHQQGAMIFRTFPFATLIVGTLVFASCGESAQTPRELSGVAIRDSLPSSEFVRRYYAQVMQFDLPEDLTAAAIFDPGIPDGEINPATGLVQYSLPSMAPPRVNDILVFGESSYNPGGHVGIVAEVSSREVVVVQQNPGPLAKTREPLRYYLRRKKWYVQHPHVVGWLHKE